MPKRVDPLAQRRSIAEAVFRLAVARGADAVSMRDVAAEAGVSLGMVQHYFRSKDEMLLFALDQCATG
jgi:TetR/AcrR family transcriptional regulator, transcriptional repressor of bet genes